MYSWKKSLNGRSSRNYLCSYDVLTVANSFWTIATHYYYTIYCSCNVILNFLDITIKLILKNKIKHFLINVIQ